MALDIPVLFLVFNRPESASRVLEHIAHVSPRRLYVASDGPRNEEDERAVVEVRRLVTDVGWDCQVETLFRDRNLGCKQAVSQALTWFFKKEEMGIVLEDDCLPHADFFSFCEELLYLYAADERIMAITGKNFQSGRHHGVTDYYFSKHFHCWGWASWRRAWNIYQGDIPFWAEWQASDDWKSTHKDAAERRYWTWIMDSVYRGEIDSWAYPWMACIWEYGGLTATPNTNLVQNIGFGEHATHTKGSSTDTPARGLGRRPLVHPAEVIANEDADRRMFNSAFGGRNWRWPRYPVWLGWRFARRAAKSLVRPIATIATSLSSR